MACFLTGQEIGLVMYIAWVRVCGRVRARVNNNEADAFYRCNISFFFFDRFSVSSKQNVGRRFYAMNHTISFLTKQSDIIMAACASKTPSYLH